MPDFKLFFEFLEKSKRYNAPIEAKLLFQIPLTENELIVDGSLDFFGSKKIVNLPNGLTINGDLNLGYSSIKKLPKNLKVLYWLNLAKTSITKLPDDLVIGGDLTLFNSKVIYFPDTIEVGGDIFINESNEKINIPKKFRKQIKFTREKINIKKGG